MGSRRQSGSGSDGPFGQDDDPALGDVEALTVLLEIEPDLRRAAGS